MKVIIFIALLFPLSRAYSHGDEDHSEAKMEAEVSEHSNIDDSAVILAVRKKYTANVAKIFESKCFNCHSGITNYPWYYKIPGIKQLIDADIEEAREHLDMSDGYPFKGHGSTPLADLKALKKVVAEESMPPWYYTPFHDNSKLNENEKKIINNWIDESISTIKN